MMNFGALSVDPLVEAIKNKLVSYVSDELSLAANFKSDLEKIKNKFEEIQALLEDAEKRSLSEDSSQLNMWLKRIKDAAHDMEDLMEDIRMGPYPPEIAPAMSEGISDRFIKLVLAVVSFCSPVISRLWPSLAFSDPESLKFQLHMGHMMKGVSDSLDKILREKSNLNLIISQPRSRRSTEIVRPPTFSAIDESTVYGRDKEKKEIIDFLLGSGDASTSFNANKIFRVIAVVGIGGLGKTTLAQLVYNDKRIIKKQDSDSFEKFLWVSVPVDFDLKAVIKTMFDNCKRQEENNDDLQYMSTYVQDHLRGKKVFVVMDDVWSKDKDKWNRFMAIIKDCKRGSVILVTTRSKDVSECVKADHNINLEGLSSEDSWKLLCSKAFKNDEEMKRCSRLHSIGKDIIKICCGVPLAINAVGAILYEKRSEEYWKRILSDQNNFWESVEKKLGSMDDEKKIMYSLKLTFSRMSSELKRCFTYCSLFPKGYIITKNELIYQWISIGHTASYVDGEIQFDSLLSMCFLQMMRANSWQEDGFVMHDIARELAQNIAGEEIIISHAENLNICEISRCVFIDGTSFQEEMTKIKATKLRALRCADHKILTNLDDMRYLHTLIIKGRSNLRQLPGSLRISRHLQYLDISGCSVNEIPEYIWELKNLKFLNMSTNKIYNMRECIGNLTSLQFLDFSNCMGSKSRSETIGKVEKLPDLIWKLENLRTLNLSFCTDLKRIPESVGEMRNLHHLLLSGCVMLRSLPESMGDLNNLKMLYLRWCSSLQSLPGSIGNLRSLEFLNLSKCRSLKFLPDSIGKLENLRTLNLSTCSELERIPESVGKMRSLNHLSLEGCRRIRSLPESIGDLNNLKTLDLNSCLSLRSLPASILQLTSLKICT